MARKRKKYVYLAPKNNLKPFEILTTGLALIGHPFYLLLSRLVIAFIFLLYLVGHTARLTVKNIWAVAFRARKIHKPLQFPKFKLPKFPRIVIPEVRRPVRLSLLKLQLISLRVVGVLKGIKLPHIRLRPIFFLLVPTASFIFLLFAFYYFILRDLPSPTELTTRQIEVSTKIYDRNGVLLYKIFKDKNRTIIPLEKVPLQVRLATLAAEDAEFYEHKGFSIRGIIRALTRNIERGELSGGSTITQQLVKNALLSSEKTLIRKLREIILSVWTEQTFTKDQILEMYLNEVSYGGNVYGIEEASLLYFDKEPRDLTLGEAALLAGLPKSPTRFSPYGATSELAIERQKEVLRLMRINKFIDRNLEDQALAEKITFTPNKTEIKASHFVMYVKDILAEKYGEEVLQKGGLEVTTTLDYRVQELAEKIVLEEVEKLKNLHVGNGAALVLNPQTGEILAMVGSKNYFDIANDGNVNVVTRPRQPGSSIKLINYAYALSNDYTLASIIDDSPLTFSVPGQPPYSPKNYDSNYRGKIPLRSALAESRNIPAVKVLASYGVGRMIDQGRKMGITTWNDPSRYGLSLTLGGGEVKLLDLARAYASIANYGERPEIVTLLEVKNYKGKTLERNECSNGLVGCTVPVVDSRVSYLLIDILKDNGARAPAFGSNSALVIPNHPEVAVKTGTSNDLKDNLTFGFNQKYLVATWVGNNDSSPMARIASGVTGASPIWNKIMSALLANEPSIPWNIPERLVQVSICSEKPEWFLKEKVPTKECMPVKPEEVNGEKIIEPAARWPQ